MNIQCRQYPHGSKDYNLALELRTKILREPLGLTFSAEELALENVAFHFGAFLDDRMVGTLMLVPVEDDADSLKMRQVAVAAEAQSQGVGSALVQFAEHFARQNGYKQIQLHARDSAVPFYLALGYEKYGDMFFEVTIPHQEMVKVL